ncbi:antibiotic biosynthesis monooxygenase [Streptomyces sp. NPDC053493]|uniref:antibiotic biosynthesis monooxygenase n=1 Tax=Streptomyces sp. NPDC053493 TaxID=3365705 RepID=UPI0037D259E4
MYQRDRNPELTVMGRVLTTAPPGEFEPELLAYARYRESRRGFVSRVTAALTERPGGYVYLDRWIGLDRLLRAAHPDPAAPAGPRRLAAALHAEAELMVTVGQMTVQGGPADAARLLFVRAVVAGDTERFELDFGALVGRCVPEEGFGGSSLLRSVADPYAYTGLLWWRDAAAEERVRASADWRERRARLADSARLTEDPARPLDEP